MPLCIWICMILLLIINFLRAKDKEVAFPFPLIDSSVFLHLRQLRYFLQYSSSRLFQYAIVSWAISQYRNMSSIVFFLSISTYGISSCEVDYYDLIDPRGDIHVAYIPGDCSSYLFAQLFCRYGMLIIASPLERMGYPYQWYRVKIRALSRSRSSHQYCNAMISR